MNKVTYKLLTLMVALCLMNHVVMAQGERHITLEEAINFSLQNSNYLKLSSARITEATAVLREAKDRRLPDFTVSGSYLRIKSANHRSQSETRRRRFRQYRREHNKLHAESESGGLYPGQCVAAPVSGFRTQYGIESAKYLEQAAKLDAEKDREEVDENTIAAYSNLYKAKSALDLVRENLKQSEQRVVDFSHLEQNGLLARNDL